MYRLYKYRSLGKDDLDKVRDYTSRIITHREVFYSAPDNFNDPFDCQASVCMDAANLSRFGQANSDEIRTFAQRRLRDRTNKEYAVFALTEVNDCPLMWSHYADDHRGICLELTFESTEPLHQVQYKPDRPPSHFADFYEEYRDQERFEKSIMDTLTTKSLEWAYEKEYRCIDFDGPGVRYLPRGSITGIIFGWRCDEENQEMVRGWVAASGECVKFFKAVERDGSSLSILYRNLTNPSSASPSR